MLTQKILKQNLRYNKKTGAFTWRVARGGHMHAGDLAGSKSTSDGYIYISVLDRSYAAHRLAWLYVHGRFPVDQLDHINRIRHDNRFTNLREATRAENMRNVLKLSSNKSGFKGVYFNKETKKYMAQARVNGKRHYIGLFSTAEAAGAAYTAFVVEHHGEFVPA